MADLSGRVALVIGVGSPLGAAAARQLAAMGATLALCDWVPDKAESLAIQLSAQRHTAQAFPADPSKKLDLQSMLERVLGAQARIDLLVNALNVQPGAALLDLDEWDWRRALDYNLTAAFLAMQSVGRVMRQLGGGQIINLLAEDPGDRPSYQAAAAGLEALSRAAAAEFSVYNITVRSRRLAPDADELGGVFQQLLAQ